MTQSPKTEKTEAGPPPPAPQTKRYDAAFKQPAVENWIKTGKPGTQIAEELGISYPSLKEWKRRYYGAATPQRDDLAAENRALKAEHTLAQLCAAFEVKRSGYQAWVQAGASPHERTDAPLLPKIRAVPQPHWGRYGAPRI